MAKLNSQSDQGVELVGGLDSLRSYPDWSFEINDDRPWTATEPGANVDLDEPFMGVTNMATRHETVIEPEVASPGPVGQGVETADSGSAPTPEPTVAGKLLDFYRKEWPRVAAVQAMALGGASLLAGRKSQKNLRALAVMNAMTMCAHQYEEYVDPGYLPGQINIGMFKSKQPLNWPFSPNGAMCANVFFRGIYVPAMIWPKKKWVGLPPVLLGIFQAFAHGSGSIREVMKTPRRYSPGTLTAVMLHVPIGVTYLRALRAQGPISRSDWVKSAGVLGAFFALGVLAPNVAFADRDSPYTFTAKQMGPYLSEIPEGAANKSATRSEVTD